MIKLADATILDLLPETIAGEPETRAFSFAIQQQLKKVMEGAARTKVWSNVTGLWHDMLDALAAELRAPNYSEEYALSVKRDLVQNTIAYYMKAGTPGAIKDIVEAIFTNGDVIEWYSYGGAHHNFRVSTTNPAISGEKAEEFMRVVESIKRKSTIFNGVIVTASTETMQCCTGFGVWITDAVTLKPTNL